MKIEPGSYIATVTNWGLKKTSKGEPQVALEFTLKESGARTMYYGLLRRGSEGFKYTVQNLLRCGFVGNDLSELARGKEANLFDGREVELVMEAQTFVNDKGEAKETVRIKYINQLGGQAFKDAMNPSEAKASLGDLKGDFLAIRREMGLEKPKPKNFAPGADMDEELPF